MAHITATCAECADFIDELYAVSSVALGQGTKPTQHAHAPVCAGFDKGGV